MIGAGNLVRHAETPYSEFAIRNSSNRDFLIDWCSPAFVSVTNNEAQEFTAVTPQ